MRGGGTARIEAPFFRPEADAGNPQRQNLALLARRQLTAQPLEMALGRELAIGRFCVEVGQNARKLLQRLIRINDLGRFGIERNGANVGREHLSVTVENIRTRSEKIVRRHDAGNRLRLCHAVFDQTPPDDEIGDGEAKENDSDTALGLRTRTLERAFETRLAVPGPARTARCRRKMRLALDVHDAGQK